MDVGQGQTAIQRMASLPLQIDAAGQAAAAAPLGPWKLYVKCKYGKCDAVTREYWYDANFSWVSQRLQSVCKSAEDEARWFLRSFQPINNWGKSTLQNFSIEFTDATSRIMAILGQVSNNDSTSQQRTDVRTQFTRLLNGLATQKSEMESGVRDLGRMTSAISGWNSSIDEAQGRVISEGQRVLTDMRNFTNGQPCGQGNANSQLANCQARLDSTTRTFKSVFGTLGSQITTANAAVSTLMGVIAVSVGDTQAIVDKIGSAQGAEFGSFMQKVRTMSADRGWKTLADYASQQFNNPALGDVYRRAG